MLSLPSARKTQITSLSLTLNSVSPFVLLLSGGLKIFFSFMEQTTSFSYVLTGVVVNGDLLPASYPHQIIFLTLIC